MNKFSAFIFDMDGTLVHNMHFHKKAWVEFLAIKGITMTENDWRTNNHGTVEQIMQRIFGKEHSREEIIFFGEEKEKLYRKIYAPYLKPLPGLHEFLHQIKDHKKALATMGDRNNIEFTLSGLNLQGYFDIELAGQETPKGKPHPDIFLQAAKRLGANPEDCLVFEDSYSGIEAAKNAGMKVVVLSTTHTREEIEPFDPEWIIDDYTESSLLELIR